MKEKYQPYPIEKKPTQEPVNYTLLRKVVITQIEDILRITKRNQGLSPAVVAVINNIDAIDKLPIRSTQERKFFVDNMNI